MKVTAFQITRISLLLFASLFFPITLRAESDTLTVANVVNISGDLLKVSIATLQAKIDFVEKNRGDNDVIQERFNELDEWSQSQGQDVYKRYKTTSADYMAFSAKNRVAIEDYLNDNAKARETLSSLEAQVRSLVERLDKLMQNRSKQ